MAAPANWTTVPVAGQYIYPDGTFAAGTVTFTNTLYLRDPDLNYVVVPKPVQFTLDGTGSFSGTLQATDDPDLDPEFYYTVTENIGSVLTSFPLLVPHDQIGTLQMADVDRNATIPPEPEIYVRTIDGMWGDVYTADFAIPTSSASVVAETSFGISSSAGAATAYSRGDHTHGTPAAPTAASVGAPPTTRTISNGTGITGGGDLSANRTLSVVADTTLQKSNYMKAGTLVAARQALNIIDGTNVTTTAVDDSGNNRVNLTINASGGGSLAVQKAGSLIGTRAIINIIDGTNVTTTVADNPGASRVDITIAATGSGVSLTAVTPTAEAIASTASVGVGTAAAREDHRHAMPASAAPAASAVGDTVVTGAAGTFADSGHKHAREAFASPTAQTTFGLSSAAGAATTLVRSDHTHGTPAAPTAASVGAIPNTNGITYEGAGTLASRPAAGTAGREYYATDLNTMFYDNGTSWVQLDQSAAIANSWTAIGHSYLQFNAASYNQRSRLDSILRSRMDAESTNWANLAIAGSRATVEGAAQGGWATMIRSINKLPGKTSPYTSSDGGLLICTGINDLGTLGGATAQNQTAFGHAIRFMISRWRASTIFEDTASQITYGASWTAETGKFDISSSGTERFSATTANAFTFTIPADYNGETIAVGLIGRAGVNGGVVTWSGTSGVSGTTSTDNIMALANLSNCPVVKRFTTLTSANAGQTIIGTVTTNNGLVYIDSIWLEALEAPPVVVCDIPRLTAAGYSTKYSSWNAAPALGSCDADVAAFNTVITNVKGEFDGMVQIAGIDAVLNKVATLFVDGLHPNERGAALIADEIDNARRRMTLTGVKSAALNMNMGPRYSGGMRIRRRSGYYHTADASTITTYTPVVGDMFALPFEVTEMDEQYARWAMAVNAAATSGTCTIRWGMFSDYMNKGYPDINLQELTIGTGALSISTTAGPQLNPAAQFTWWPDIANYYLVMKIETIGVGFVFAGLQGPSYSMPAGGSSGDVRVASNGAAVAWKLTGQATGAFPSTFPAGAIPANVAPYMGALKS